MRTSLFSVKSAIITASLIGVAFAVYEYRASQASLTHEAEFEAKSAEVQKKSKKQAEAQSRLSLNNQDAQVAEDANKDEEGLQPANKQRDLASRDLVNTSFEEDKLLNDNEKRKNLSFEIKEFQQEIKDTTDALFGFTREIDLKNKELYLPDDEIFDNRVSLNLTCQEVSSIYDEIDLNKEQVEKYEDVEDIKIVFVNNHPEQFTNSDIRRVIKDQRNDILLQLHDDSLYVGLPAHGSGPALPTDPKPEIEVTFNTFFDSRSFKRQYFIIQITAENSLYSPNKWPETFDLGKTLKVKKIFKFFTNLAQVTPLNSVDENEKIQNTQRDITEEIIWFFKEIVLASKLVTYLSPKEELRAVTNNIFHYLASMQAERVFIEQISQDVIKKYQDKSYYMPSAGALSYMVYIASCIHKDLFHTQKGDSYPIDAQLLPSQKRALSLSIDRFELALKNRDYMRMHYHRFLMQALIKLADASVEKPYIEGQAGLVIKDKAARVFNKETYSDGTWVHGIMRRYFRLSNERDE